jgi:hypothetical protein
MDRPFEPGSSGLMFYGHGDERTPVREVYGAFRRPANDADRRVGGLAAQMLDRIEAEVVKSEGRLLLSDLEMVYAVPVGDDQVAFAVLPNGGGMCHVPGPDGLLMLQHQTEEMDLVVHGMAGDSIEFVDLVVAGVTHSARMGENAFGLRLEGTHEADLERLVLHRRDGTTGVFELRPDDSD